MTNGQSMSDVMAERNPRVGTPPEKGAAAEQCPRQAQIAFYWCKLAFLLFFVPIILALIFPFLPFVDVFDEGGSGLALVIIIGHYVIYAGPVWLLGTVIGLVADFRAWLELKRAHAPSDGRAGRGQLAFNAVFWLVFLPVAGFIAWGFLPGFFR